VSTLFGVRNTEGTSRAMLFFDTHPLPSFLVNRSNLKIIAVNKAGSNLLQVATQDLYRLTFTDLLVSADKIKTAALLQQSTADAPLNTLVQVQKTASEVLTTEMHVQTLVNGNDILHQITLIDVTSRYAKQEQLAATAQRYKGFIDQNSEGIYCQDLKEPIPVSSQLNILFEAIKESIITECNDALAQMYGYDYGSQMIGIATKDLVDFTDEANVDYIKNFITNDFKVVSAESHEKDRFNNPVFFLNNAIGIVEDGYLKRIWGSQRDITNVKQVEQKVRLLADLVEQTSDVLTAADLNFKPITWNKAAEKIYGLTGQQVIGKNIRQFIDIHYTNTTREEIRTAIDIHGGWRGEMSFIRPTDQKLVTILTGYKLMKDENDEPLGYIISGTEITERKEKEQKLRLLANLVENTSDILIALDSNFNAITWNKAAERLSGIKAEQVIGRMITDFLELHYQGISFQDVRAIVEQKGEWRGELYFIRPEDGSKINLLASYKLFKDELGNTIGFIITSTEITAYKESELLLQESEGRFREMANSAPVGIWIVDTQDKLVYVNKYLEEYTGFTTEELIGTSWTSLIHPDEAKAVVAIYNEHFTKRLPVKIIYHLRNNKGEYRWIQESAIPRFLEDGTFLGYIGSAIDIHDVKLKEEQLQSQATILENVLDCIITSDLEFKIVSLNRTGEEICGYTEADVIGKDLRDLVEIAWVGVSADDVGIQLSKKGIYKGEVIITDHKGVKRNFLNTITYITDKEGNRVKLMIVFREITERKRAEEKVLQSESFYRSLIANSVDGMLLMELNGTIKFVFPSIYNILGYTTEDMFGKHTLEFVHPDDVEHAFQYFETQVLKAGSGKDDAIGMHYVVIRLRKKDGSWQWSMVRAHNQLHNPNINSIVIYLHDDTLRKTAIDALKESEKRFRHLIHDLQVGVILQDGEGRIIMANQIVLENLALTEDALKGRTMLDIIGTAIDEEGNAITLTDRPLFKAITTRQPLIGVVMGLLVPKTQKRIWAMMDINPIFNDEGELIHIITSLIDITERKKLEAKLRFDEVLHQRTLTQATIDGQEKERREIGKELHDNIGQQLTTTKLFLDLARSTSDPATEEMVCLALKSVSDVINEIRGISRSLTPHTLGDLGLIESINDLVDTIIRTQTINVVLTNTAFDELQVPDNQKLMLFRIIQEQLNNIVKHAQARQVEIILQNSFTALELEIKDDGVGFDTTKLRKGLGLTNIKNRVELFGGKVQIISAEGKGCTIKISVPVNQPSLS
jgi:PAS domain S-box-containing protein